MKIVAMEVIPVAFPDPPLRNSWGVHEPWALRNLIRLEADDGTIGWGEAAGGERLARRLAAAREIVLGADPFHRQALRRRIPDPRVFSGIEVALLDLVGRHLGISVSELLGGRLRDRIEFAAYLFYHFDCPQYGECLTPRAMLEQAKRLVAEHGFRALKLKGGVLPPDEEIETIRLMRAHFGPEFRLRHDPNAIWSVPTAIRVTRELAGELEYMEDPTHGREGMAEVRRQVDVPLSTNMCVTAFEHFPEAIRLGSVDVVLADHHYWGGLQATQEMAKVCETFGLGVSMHSNSHLGISLAAMVHAAAITPHLTYACDTHYVWLEEDLLVGGKWRFEQGRLSVPTAPGLGIEVDEAIVARMNADYERCGIRERDDAGYMRRVYDPTWEPLRPRW